MNHLQTSGLKTWVTKRDEALDRLFLQARALFENAIATSYMNLCDFGGDRWESPRSALIFDQAQGLSGRFFPKGANDRQQYDDPRCVKLLKSYLSTKLKKSPTQRCQHLSAAKLVLHFCGNDLDGLSELTEARLAKFMLQYRAKGGGSATGLDCRLAGPMGFITWLSNSNLLLNMVRYHRVIEDQHGLAKSDATSPAAARKVNNKRPPANLDAALGEVVAKTEDGHNEPKPGYFRLRAICTTFMMAGGLRMGEAATLQTDCFYEHDGKTWLKVLSEKCGEPRLVPLGAGWENLLRIRHSEALELTSSARQFAVQLEDGSLLLKQREALEKSQSPVSRDGYRAAGREYLLDDKCGYFQWRSYSELGLLPTWTDAASHPLRQKAVIALKSGKSAWLAFDLYETYIRERHKKEMSDHLLSAIPDLEPDSAMLSRAGYQINLPLSKHLFVVAEDQFHANRPTKLMHPMPMSIGFMNRFLRTGPGSRSVFESLNIRNPDGTIFQLRSGICTHVFRHWKDDARFRAGCNENAMALLSGRSPDQNRAYDKRTPTELAEQHKGLYLQTFESLVPNDPLGKRVKKMLRVGASREEIELAVEETLQILHLTPWSGCSRDLDREPCPKHYKCLRGFTDQAENDSTCPNLHIDPTDLVAKDNIKYQLRVAKYQIASLTRLCGEESIQKTLNDLDLAYAPERGRSILEMQVRHQHEIIRGCEAALRTYETSSASSHKTRHGNELLQVASVNRIHGVNLINPRELRE